MPHLALVSHTLCPYVQRAAILLAEKGVPFERRWVDLADKPGWFRDISPLGKTPVLLVDGLPVFESAVICEYLDETATPRMHPADPLQRARHRGWIEFGSALLNAIGAYYTAPDAAALRARREEIEVKFAQVERVLAADGPYFAGVQFCLVDVVFAPVFRYFDAFEVAGEEGFFTHMPKVQAWRGALASRASVRQAVPPDYPQLLQVFLAGRGSELSRRLLPA